MIIAGLSGLIESLKNMNLNFKNAKIVEVKVEKKPETETKKKNFYVSKGGFERYSNRTKAENSEYMRSLREYVETNAKKPEWQVEIRTTITGEAYQILKYDKLEKLQKSKIIDTQI